MRLSNKEILEKANSHVSRGEYEEFLNYCTEDTEWTFIGEQTLKGKKAVRQYMATAYVEPPKFNTERFIAEGDFVTVIGTISLKNVDGTTNSYDYCDVWQFRERKLDRLKAFVIEIEE